MPEAPLEKFFLIHLFSDKKFILCFIVKSFWFLCVEKRAQKWRAATGLMNWEINQAESQYYCSTSHMCTPGLS
jgi:hypothetical protein